MLRGFAFALSLWSFSDFFLFLDCLILPHALWRTVVLIVNECSMRLARLGIEVLHESWHYDYTDVLKTAG